MRARPSRPARATSPAPQTRPQPTPAPPRAPWSVVVGGWWVVGGSWTGSSGGSARQSSCHPMRESNTPSAQAPTASSLRSSAHRKRVPGGPCYRFHLHARWRSLTVAIAPRTSTFPPLAARRQLDLHSSLRHVDARYGATSMSPTIACGSYDPPLSGHGVNVYPPVITPPVGKRLPSWCRVA